MHKTMKKFLFIFITACATCFVSCSNQQQTQQGNNVSADSLKLAATDFNSKIIQTPNAIILDVRTPDEFAKGHIANAKNIDWNNSDAFNIAIKSLDTTKPLLIYCMSGGRSASASSALRAKGFSVYELDGGIMKWKAADLPVVTDANSAAPADIPTSGMTLAQFQKLLETDKYVLVDFYATWCGPCKQMEPALKEISETMSDKVVVVRIDVDQNEEISKHFEIESLPTVQIYKNKKLTWEDIGYKTKKQLVNQLK
jgi:thioredoxin 1